jgi:hypothetical protein
MKQLAFFVNPSRLSWEINPRLSDQIFDANHLIIFPGYGVSTLKRWLRPRVFPGPGPGPKCV